MLPETAPIECSWDLSALPALWAFPQIDFDDGSGFAVVGNVFGELALIDCVGGSLPAIPRALDYTDEQTTLAIASQDLIPLYLPPLIPSTSFQFGDFDSTLHDPAVTESWGKELTSVTIPHGWSTEWSSSPFSAWYEWRGLLLDWAWMIEHDHGFLGNVHPVAFRIPRERYSFSAGFILRAGGLLFKRESEDEMWAYPGSTDILSIMNDSYPVSLPGGKQFASGYCSKFWEARAYFENCVSEYAELGLNRWVKQKARGGNPPEDLLSVWQRRSQSGHHQSGT